MMSRWRLIGRLAWREVVRHRLRTVVGAVLVAASVAVAVAGFAWTDARRTVRNEELVERAVVGDGAAVLSLVPQLVVRTMEGSSVGDDPVLYEEFLRERLARTPGIGTQALDIVIHELGFARRDDERTSVVASDLGQGRHPLGDPSIVVLDGRLPGPGEAAVARSAMERLGVRIGDEIALEPWSVRRVVGVYATGLSELDVWRDVTRSSVLLDALDPSGAGGRVRDRGAVAFVRDPSAVHLDSEVVTHREFRGSVTQWLQEAVRLDRTGARVAIGAGFAVALLVVGFVAAATSMVAAPGELRSAGLLAAAGARPSIATRVLFVRGVIGAGAGSAVGAVVGAVVVAVGAVGDVPAVPLQPVTTVGLTAWHVAVPVVAAVVAGVVAAVQPARILRRVPVVTALAGRRRLPPMTAALSTGGIGVVAVSAGFLIAWPAGERVIWMDGLLTASALLGIAALAPSLVTRLPKMAQRSPAVRLAVRSTVRHRTRSSAVMAAALVPCAAVIHALVVAPYATADDAIDVGVETINHVAAWSVVLGAVLALLFVVVAFSRLIVVEEAAELMVLHALGAPADLIGRRLAWQAGLTTLVAVVLAVPTALIAATVVTDVTTLTAALPVAAWMVLALPVLAALVTRGVAGRLARDGLELVQVD